MIWVGRMAAAAVSLWQAAVRTFRDNGPEEKVQTSEHVVAVLRNEGAETKEVVSHD